MMAQLFAEIVNMTLTASVVIVIVIFARLWLKQAPKIYSYLLWIAVLFALLCPISIELKIPMKGNDGQNEATTSEYVFSEQQNNAEDTTYSISEIANFQKFDNLESVYKKYQSDSSGAIKTTESVLSVGGWIWATGMITIFGVTVLQSIQLRRKLVNACIIRSNIYESGDIDTAFVIGIFKPRIYLPAGLPFDVWEIIVVHEQIHQSRGDHIVKLIAYIAAAVHWFNPLAWAAFNLICSDMEKSCDEAAIRQMVKRGNNEKDVKYEYGKMLLFLGGGNKNIFSTVSFAENDVAERVKNVLVNKRSSRAVNVIIGALIILLLAACLFNPYVLSFETVNSDDVYVPLSTADTEEANDPVPAPIKITIGQSSFWSNAAEISLYSAGYDMEKLGNCTNLETLHLENCVLLDLSFLSSVPSLKSLYINNCTITDISTISSAAHLESLSMSGCDGYTEEELYYALNGIDGLESLSYFPLNQNTNQIDLSFVAGMNGIKELEVSVNKQKDIDDICTLHTLERLTILEGTGLVGYDWSGLSKLSNLTEFTLQVQTESYSKGECEKMIEGILTALSEVKSLRAMYINPEASMMSLPTSPQLWGGLSELEYLFISMAGDVDSLDFLSRMSSLKELTVFGDSFDIKALSNLSKLESLYLRGNNAENLNALSQLNELKKLNLDLSQDNINECVACISDMSELRELSFGYLIVFSDLTFLETLPELEALSIHNIEEETDLSSFERCPALNTLIIDGAFSDIRVFGNMDGLENLSLSGGNIESLSPLKECSSLTELYAFCNNAADAEGLSECTNLKSIEIIAPLDSIRFINALPNLRKLTLLYANYTDSELADFAANNPYCEINVE